MQVPISLEEHVRDDIILFLKHSRDAEETLSASQDPSLLHYLR